MADFHISRAARAKYEVDDALFSERGTVVFANFYAARLLALKINATRGATAPQVQAGELNALGLIHEILHAVLQTYRTRHSGVMAEAVSAVETTLGAGAVEDTLRTFIDQFPPLTVYHGQETTDQYLNGATDGVPNRELLLEELLLIWLQNQNPAASPFKELFDDSALAAATAYPAIIATLRDFFAVQEPIGETGQSLFEALRAPLLDAPASLAAQLDYILYHWRAIAGGFDMARFAGRALSSIQFLREEEQYLWTRAANPFGGGGGFTSTTPPVPEFRREMRMRVDPATGQEVWYPEPEQFSPDLDWMPNLVLLAKSTYVWLDQLSKKYATPITRLDQIPDAELDELRRRGITGLWFIGVWERSPASARIKHMLGNTGAMASAYSLYDYEIAEELGGAEALEQLKARAWERRIRIASDMVPNHMGIDSRWVMEHPEWFIQSAVPPYPAYSYRGANLSANPNVALQIEDHYWDKTDAAVVFKRTEPAKNDVRYIYHGNDGTTFPWNDTAQLNYLMAEVREQVIQTILRVARLTPVIRFDAAMTLAKKHYQRLWYPLPGEANTIPSRGEYSMTKAQFDAAMPEEFWREVVDRVAAEAPDTLLLAEAFWLMEGYFVRTLGMHRVYNSAFMHMLRDEKNQEYRLVIKNTIEFDPEVLRRYVNFMNNPDERTAVDQFGKGDKYFGVCVLMATMPGLPMFGHGQIEGFTERYGMEFRAAMLDETPDPWLLERHVREIFPLLHKRHLFAGVENFLLYDVFRPNGTVEENVFAYSNRFVSPRGEERSLVLYNNSYTEARGVIRLSAAFRDKAADKLVQRTLAAGLNLTGKENSFVIFREHISNLEYLRRANDLIRNGLPVALGAYKYAVYLDFREVVDTPERAYAALYERLRGQGVPSVDQTLREMQLAPLHLAFRSVVNADTLRAATAPRAADGELAPARTNLTALLTAPAETTAADGAPSAEAARGPKPSPVAELVRVLNEWSGAQVPAETFIGALEQNLAALETLTHPETEFKRPAKKLTAALDALDARLDDSTRAALAALALVQPLEAFVLEPPHPIAETPVKAAPGDARADDTVGTGHAAAKPGDRVAVWLDDWQLGKLVGEALRGAGADDARAWQLVTLLKLGLEHPNPTQDPAALLADEHAAHFLNINEFADVVWYNQEAFTALTNWLRLSGAWDILRTVPDAKSRTAALVKQSAAYDAWNKADAASDYHLDALLAALSPKRRKQANGQTLARTVEAETKSASRTAKSTAKASAKKTTAVKTSRRPRAKPTPQKRPAASTKAASKPARKPRKPS